MSNWQLSEEECIKIIEAEPRKISEDAKNSFRSKEEQIEICKRILENLKNESK